MGITDRSWNKHSKLHIISRNAPQICSLFRWTSQWVLRGAREWNFQKINFSLSPHCQSLPRPDSWQTKWSWRTDPCLGRCSVMPGGPWQSEWVICVPLPQPHSTTWITKWAKPRRGPFCSNIPLRLSCCYIMEEGSDEDSGGGLWRGSEQTSPRGALCHVE